ncbi:MarR family transcriptional regulator [Streptomyces salyersiae]|uniref:MarR family transcriptional regulator n=1 Tax=Streptomyces salyersiae TaxID=3075530 RepID=A0ABU2RVM7_9ACTN|nr:MarR family transcriptional regulator [Streptomyces sp. DSM 41770]MDT0432890.1 MarR family transcriptional regulator [Streptomyces sp. DSM 41770]
MTISLSDLSMAHPVYTLNLTAAQRSALEWLTCNGALYEPMEVDPKQIAEDCGTSVSTVYEALTRLTSLRLLDRTEGTNIYRVSPRFFFAQNPEIAQLVLDALTFPDVVPDERAHRPRRTSAGDMQRRREVRPVS